MPDLETVFSSVRTRMCSSVRSQIEVLDRRREELERQLADVDREHARLTAGLSVIEEHLSHALPSPSSEVSEETVPLAERVFDAVRAGASSRRALIRIFEPQGVKPNTLDGTLFRLRKRGAIRRDGRRLAPVVESLEPGSSDPSPGLAREISEVRASAEEDQRPGARRPVEPSPSADGDWVPLTTRVLEAVRTSTGVTRRALVRHFVAQGIKAGSVDTALAGLRKRGRLERRADGVLALASVDVSSAPAGADSPES